MFSEYLKYSKLIENKEFHSYCYILNDIILYTLFGMPYAHNRIYNTNNLVV